MQRILTDFLQWQSKLTLEKVFEQGENFSYPTPFAEGVLYLSQLKDENNRSALVYKKADRETGQSFCLTPEPFNLRTKINEYGGKPFWITKEAVLFVNYADQRLYQQTINSEHLGQPKAVSPEPDENQLYMYSDVLKLPDKWLVAIVETAITGKQSHSENKHAIQAFNLDSTKPELIPLVSGASFYSNLVISQDCTRVAWVQWNHPAMPWDETELWVADIVVKQGTLDFVNRRRINLDLGASVCQLHFANNGHLFFSADFKDSDVDSFSNYWNIYRDAFDGLPPKRVTELQAEFGYPHWQYGDARIVQFDDEYLITYASTLGGDQLYLIHQQSLKVVQLYKEQFKQKTLKNLASNGAGVLTAIMLSADSNSALIEIRTQSKRLPNTFSTLSTNPEVLDKADISIAEHFGYATSDGARAYGYYYPPVNIEYSVADPPPLIVMVHGGPTAQAYGFFDIQKQFWTNRGFAIFDVNHRGSCGYGRAYRDALYGQWGVVDTNDIVDGIKYLIGAGKADADKVCIRGKSAGGYAVLRALTEYPDLFQAGACYYGIGNLATLAEVTHKFEKFYTDRLIGESYDPKTANVESSLFYQRSPIHKVSQIKAAMIIFQGSEDKIVPPSIAEEIVSDLKRVGVTYSYIEFPEEGHGFRQVSNNIEAWSQELNFYRTILSR